MSPLRQMMLIIVGVLIFIALVIVAYICIALWFNNRKRKREMAKTQFNPYISVSEYKNYRNTHWEKTHGTD